MQRLVVQRAVQACLTILLIYTAAFALFQVTPGSPFHGDPRFPDVREKAEAFYGFDRPWWEQYVSFGWNALQGDLGPSFVFRGRDVTDIIRKSLPITFQLAAAGAVLGASIGVPLGLLGALKRNSVVDYLATGVATLGISLPTYVLVAALIAVLAVKLGWVPTGGWDGLFSKRSIIPVLALSAEPTAVLARYTRTSALEILGKDYIRTARAKGLSELVVTLRHTLKNALIPVVTIAGLQFAYTLSGTFYVEVIANIPGMGREAITALTGRDYPVIMGIVLVVSVVIISINFIVDLMYLWLDPRIRYT